MAVLVKNGKVRTSGGKIRTGAAGDPCCCGCCTCERATPYLATSYSVDLVGDWDLTGLCPCEPSSDTDTLDLNAGLTCGFGSDSYPIGDKCLVGVYVFVSLLQLATTDDECFFWTYTIQFWAGECEEAPVQGPLYRYRQRADNCTDPTGIYDLYEGDSSLVPPTVTIS